MKKDRRKKGRENFCVCFSHFCLPLFVNAPHMLRCCYDGVKSCLNITCVFHIFFRKKRGDRDDGGEMFNDLKRTKIISPFIRIFVEEHFSTLRAAAETKTRSCKIFSFSLFLHNGSDNNAMIAWQSPLFFSSFLLLISGVRGVSFASSSSSFSSSFSSSLREKKLPKKPLFFLSLSHQFPLSTENTHTPLCRPHKNKKGKKDIAF